MSFPVRQCDLLGIGAFRVNSQILPLATHPASGYRLPDLDEDGSITAAFQRAGRLASDLDVRLSFHPDQFVVLNSERPEVVTMTTDGSPRLPCCSCANAWAFRWCTTCIIIAATLMGSMSLRSPTSQSRHGIAVSLIFTYRLPVSVGTAEMPDHTPTT